jgi:hypothetical protein
MIRKLQTCCFTPLSYPRQRFACASEIVCRFELLMWPTGNGQILCAQCLDVFDHFVKFRSEPVEADMRPHCDKPNIIEELSHLSRGVRTKSGEFNRRNTSLGNLPECAGEVLLCLITQRVKLYCKFMVCHRPGRSTHTLSFACTYLRRRCPRAPAISCNVCVFARCSALALPLEGASLPPDPPQFEAGST